MISVTLKFDILQFDNCYVVMFFVMHSARCLRGMGGTFFVLVRKSPFGQP